MRPPASRPAPLGVSRFPSPEGLATSLSPWGEDAAAQTTERPSLAQAFLPTLPYRPPVGLVRETLGSWALTASALGLPNGTPPPPWGHCS